MKVLEVVKNMANSKGVGFALAALTGLAAAAEFIAGREKDKTIDNLAERMSKIEEMVKGS